MKYDFLKEVETNTYPNDNVGYESGAKVKRKGARKLTGFHIAVINLSICIMVSLVFLALQLWSDIEFVSLGQLVKETFAGGGKLLL